MRFVGMGWGFGMGVFGMSDNNKSKKETWASQTIYNFHCYLPPLERLRAI